MGIIDIQYQSRETDVAKLVGADDQDIEDVALDTAANAGDVALLTYLARALNTQGQDEVVVRVTDSQGTQVDPRGFPNKTGVVGDTITPGAGGSAFTDQSVPRGFAVVVQNDPTNNDNVQVQDDGGTDRHVLEPGATISLYVDNLNRISVTGTSNNPSVHATVEAP